MKEREMNEKLVFERSRKGRRGFRFPETGVPAVWGKSGRPSGPGATNAPETTGGRTGPAAIQPIGADRVTANLRREVPEGLIRGVPADLPELSEVDVIRHYTGLSRRNYGVDIGFYPLGSCTMKYNPKVNEEIAKLPGLAEIHPLQPEDTVQGMLALLHETLTMLSEVTGMSWGTLQPLAGAHGEFTGMKLFRAYFRSRGEDDRRVIIVPDSSHGTNPASAHIAGFDVVEIPSDGRGMVSPEVLRPYLNGNLAGIMMTNPNTLGIFERDIKEISALIHEAGGLLYYDGANMNAILGKARPGDMGFDVVHLNLHKTFSTPHGGGGPGSGAVLVNEKLRPFLPGPDIRKEGARYRWAGDDRYRRAGGGEANGGGQASDGILGGTGTSPGNNETSLSIGRMAAFHGNIGVVVRAWAYLKAMGGNGLERASELAVLNANYLKEKLKKIVTLPYDTLCKHEFVLSAKELKESCGASALDIAKGLLDYGVHPPTIYFPLIVPEALMIEPTETESVETLDSFVETMRGIVETARQNPGVLKEAPARTVVRRIDEVTAAKRPIVRWKQGEER